MSPTQRSPCMVWLGSVMSLLGSGPSLPGHCSALPASTRALSEPCSCSSASWNPLASLRQAPNALFISLFEKKKLCLNLSFLSIDFPVKSTLCLPLPPTPQENQPSQGNGLGDQNLLKSYMLQSPKGQGGGEEEMICSINYKCFNLNG